MRLDEPFPFDRVSLRARKAILQKFEGRHPSIREVARISDASWLTDPGVGPATLEQIYRVTATGTELADLPCAPQLSDVELIERLYRLQQDLLRVQGALEEIAGHSRNGRC
jgi:hypothetical protein